MLPGQMSRWPLDAMLFHHPPRMINRDVAGCGDVNYSKVAAQIVFVTRGCVLDDRGSCLGARKTRDLCRMRDNINDNPPNGTLPTTLINARCKLYFYQYFTMSIIYIYIYMYIYIYIYIYIYFLGDYISICIIKLDLQCFFVSNFFLFAIFYILSF